MNTNQDTPPEGIEDNGGHRLLMSLLARHWHRIFGFVYTLVPNRADAEDVLQEASVVMWEKFGDFEPDSDFVAWANRIAFFCVQNFRRKRAAGRVLFDDRLLGRLSETAAALSEEAEERYDLLQECIESLPVRERRMVRARFAEEGNVQQAAEAVQRSVDATYKALARVRQVLAECVNRKLAADGGPA